MNTETDEIVRTEEADGAESGTTEIEAAGGTEQNGNSPDDSAASAVDGNAAAELRAALSRAEKRVTQLERERALDDLLWTKSAELVTYDYFDINVVLSFLTRLNIVNRWIALDEESGREMFRKLVKEVRGTFGEVHYEG